MIFGRVFPRGGLDGSGKIGYWPQRCHYPKLARSHCETSRKQLCAKSDVIDFHVHQPSWVRKNAGLTRSQASPRHDRNIQRDWGMMGAAAPQSPCVILDGLAPRRPPERTGCRPRAAAPQNPPHGGGWGVGLWEWRPSTRWVWGTGPTQRNAREPPKKRLGGLGHGSPPNAAGTFKAECW